MKSKQLSSFAALVSVLFSAFAPTARAQTPATPPPPEESVHVLIEYTDPLQFERMRFALMNGEELILRTLRDSAEEQARLAGYPGKVIVLDEKTAPPAEATVLRLTWTETVVTADVTRAGKNKYLGVVSRLPLSSHPEYMRLQRSIDTAGVSNARRDAALRAQVQMELYLALQYLARHQRSLATQN